MKSKRYLIVTVLVGLVVFATSFTTTLALAGSGQSPVPTLSHELPQLAHEVFDGWQYKAYRDGKNVVLEIERRLSGRIGGLSNDQPESGRHTSII